VTSAPTYQRPDYNARGRLDGHRVVIVGGGMGIGHQTALAVTDAGARVFCVDIIPERAAAVAEQVGGFAWSGDARRREDVERMLADAEAAFGSPVTDVVDIVGDAAWAPLLEIDDDTWDGQFQANLTHAFFVIQAAGRRWVQDGRRGTLAFVASPDGMGSSALHAAYGAAKAGLINLVKTAALELAPHGIRVNAIAPDAAVTPGHPRPPESVAAYEAIIPLGRMQDDTDMAGVLRWLLSDLARSVTGQTILVDGGLSVISRLPRDRKSVERMTGRVAVSPAPAAG
jgi:NAD(P)-dependent dehydrogenase (short-subunit alcohol dehydrogenase family)